MADMMIDVDVAVVLPVNLIPLLDDTDFKTREIALTYDQAGMDLVWNFVTSAGVTTQTAVTPTTGGVYDWTHVGDGMYTMEIPASGGVSINNDTEGYGFFTGVCTGVLPWRSPIFGFRAAGLNDLMTDSAYSATRGLAGTALPAAAADAAGGLPISDLGGLDMDNRMPSATAVTNANTALTGGSYNVGGGAVVAASVTGAVGSVTGAVGSVTGAVASVTAGVTLANGAHGGAAASMNLASGLTANITGNLSGSVGSVTGAVGSVTGAVGSVTGSVGSVVGHTAQTGDSYALANGASGFVAIKGDTGNLVTRITATLFSGITSLAEWLGLLAGKQVGNATALTEIKATGAGSGTFSELTDSLEAVRDRGDTAWITATGFSTLDAAGVRTAVGLASANLDTQLGDIPTVTEFEARTVVAANYGTAANQTTLLTRATELRLAELDPANLPGVLDTVAVDVAGLDGAAMRGTDSAALASVCTEGRLAELDAANLPTDVDAILADTGTDGVVLSTAQMQSLADVLLARSVSTIEATAAEHSLATLILGALQSEISGTNWIIYRTDGTTTHATKPVTTDASADPITGVS